ncbi:hypothetical protein [Synechococcus sp. BMK-MC-1]|uniref:hypothetical protein n=1 Tax=Synechococcus sp. BMK-MC-1 TaxID=1442551 RepID=UPI0016452360|nr:hypothetical protein [Synechococcus sp. BMK-MC-1]QNI66416.1 hypothetical protein SynBMKMC1_00304 [Synechococcus sp. BMK-MC-1]
MKIAVHILCYNVNTFLPHVVANCHPYVEKVYLAWSPHSWGYGQSVIENPTNIYSYNLPVHFPKCELVIGSWSNEQDMRNACLNKAREDGFDWLIIQDADEFYTESSWKTIVRVLSQLPQEVNLVKSTWLNFWKHPSIILVNHDGQTKTPNAGFALRLTPQARFIDRRLTNYSGSDSEAVLDVPCFHYGWVLNDEEINLKIRTWGHANDFNHSLWYELKWKRWSLATRNLRPANPCSWPKAVFYLGELPTFVHDIFGPELAIPSRSLTPKISSFRLIIKEFFYDLEAKFKWLKYFIRNTYLR